MTGQDVLTPRMAAVIALTANVTDLLIIKSMAMSTGDGASLGAASDAMNAQTHLLQTVAADLESRDWVFGLSTERFIQRQFEAQR